MELIETYKITVLVIGLIGLLAFIQLAVIDIASIKAKHIPGHPIPANHNTFLFRASRALANTNESVAIFILFVAFALLSSANPQWLNIGSSVYLLGRMGHMIFYYLNFKLLRSIAFAISLMGLLTMFIAGIVAWF
ncbi:MAPEG family protein (plasmid) [Pseudoalteromonas sp. T1lg65]|uniref:MAPEG family protein n=1 Tax=Pseudoalteromonas sp. T1lg65 TaxID=2077101 RepID=UPI003F79F251